MRFRNNFLNWLTLGNSNPTLVRAQIEAFQRQLPLMYFMVCMNSVMLAMSFYDEAPLTLTLFFPAILVGAICWRFWRWRSQESISTPDKAENALRSTVYFTFLLGACFTSWALMLFPYGDARGQMHIAFYIAVTAVACTFCLMHLRVAAIALLLVVMVPFTLFFLLTATKIYMVIAANALLASGATFIALSRYYKDFEALIESKQALETKQAELEDLNRENLLIAHTDSLTQLPNRRAFFAELTKRLLWARRNDERLTVAVLDLDGFKPINDIYGHICGDHLLVEVAKRLQRLSGTEAFVARLGGDEFGAIIDGSLSDAEVRRLGLEISIGMREPFALAALNAKIGASIGFACFPNAGITSEQLYECADYALYYAKRHARGTAVLFADKHETEIRETSLVGQSFQQANLEDELTLAFHPIINIETGETACVEALARWSNAALGAVEPNVFIKAAERSGQIGQVTSILLKRALKLAETWPEHMRMSFNLSFNDIASREAAQTIIKIIKDSNIDPRRLDFEVTESAVMKNIVQGELTLNQLKGLGASISLDDFGCGHSSLSHVHRLPLDKIKIDRMFVAEAGMNTRAENIIKSVVELCNTLNLECIVEGMETEAQLRALHQLGCRYAQGYLFCRPIPEDQIEAYFLEPSHTRKLVA